MRRRTKGRRDESIAACDGRTGAAPHRCRACWYGIRRYRNVTHDRRSLLHHERQLQSPEGQLLLAALRTVCARLPEVREVIDGFGHTTFKVAKKSFLIAGMGEDGGAISIKSDPITQAHLVSRGPYYRTPYIGQHGWVSIGDPLTQDWEEIEELIAEGYRSAAPKRLVKLLS
jgi:predicted DNA-binding protein (MmcQ/YjbR family)